MGILKEMFSEESGDFEKRPAELLAKGKYVSQAETILEGYKTFQLRYVLKSLILKLLLVILALASSIMMLMSDSSDITVSVFCIMICVCVGIYFITEPFKNRKNLKNGLAQLEGIEYEAEITDQYIKISTVPDENAEENDEEKIEDISSEDDKEEKTDDENDNEIPATIIHLDSSIVDFIDEEDMFIVCVKKSYVFIIPNSAFTEDEVQRTREKLSAIMGIRFKITD